MVFGHFLFRFEAAYLDKRDTVCNARPVANKPLAGQIVHCHQLRFILFKSFGDS